MDMQEWMKNAIKAIESEISFNQTFELKSLFKECLWKNLSKGERIGFGKFFANEVREGRVEKVSAIERGKNNHSKYIKK